MLIILTKCKDQSVSKRKTLGFFFFLQVITCNSEQWYEIRVIFNAIKNYKCNYWLRLFIVTYISFYYSPMDPYHMFIETMISL